MKINNIKSLGAFSISNSGGGGGGGDFDENKVIVKSATMPTASASNLGKFYIYSGQTDANYTNGYIYVSVLEERLVETVDFSTDKFSCEPATFWLIVKAVLPSNYQDVTHGTITYSTTNDTFIIDFKDASETSLLQFPIEKANLEYFGFTIGTFEDGESFTFTCSEGVQSVYSWKQLGVQPSSGIKSYKASTYTVNTTLLSGYDIPIPNIASLTESGIYNVSFDYVTGEYSTTLYYTLLVNDLQLSGTHYTSIQTLVVDVPQPFVNNQLKLIINRAVLSEQTFDDWAILANLSNPSIPWGRITGTLADQTDLKTELDKKIENSATGSRTLQLVGSGGPSAYNQATIVGFNARANGDGAIAIGAGTSLASASSSALAIGHAVSTGTSSICISMGNSGTNYAQAENSIQLGDGNNMTANLFQVYSYPMLDGNTGKIPSDRMTKVIDLTTASTELASDNIYNGYTLASVTLTLPESYSAQYPNFITQVNFTSGSTPTTFTAPNNIYFNGDDCNNGTLTPVANKRYFILIFASGVYPVSFIGLVMSK